MTARSVAATSAAHHSPAGTAGRLGLTVGALGVVYGDIGTSPLYALRESFTSRHHPLPVTEANVLGVVSLVFWSLLVIITVKYLAFVMRADNDGEGGILALTALVAPRGRARRGRTALVLLGLFGTALLYGDGMITPAISVLSAVEGTEVATSGFRHWVLPISVAILVGLFLVQRRGTASIGRVFGPVMVVWFAVLAVLGLTHVVEHPGILAAVDPLHAARFFVRNGFTGFLALGSVFLVVTGGEALYADMGHFGAAPIRRGWFALVLPALLCNYFGQGALLLHDAKAVDNPFYRLAPGWAVIPLVVLATSATVIASQALISGAYSLTMQAVQLGFVPRVRVTHTSETSAGQIYIASVNWILLAACLALVLGFRSSTNLASAYGLAVTATMLITALLFFVVLRERFGWPRTQALALSSVFLVIDAGFFGANVFKVPDGGWFPLVVAAGVFTLMTTWRTGRRLVAERIHRGELTLEALHERLRDEPCTRVPGTALYLFSSPGLAPPALLANLAHNHVLHEHVVVLSIVTEDVPRVALAERSTVTELGDGLRQVVLHYGFVEEPDVRRGLAEGDAARLAIDVDTATFVLGVESLRVTPRPGMARWREHLFAFLLRNSARAANWFGLPTDRTVELGVQVEL